MKSIRLITVAVAALVVACSNLPQDDSSFKAYPNPYNPNNGVLTMEKLSGTYATTDHHDLVVLNYALAEVYRSTVAPNAVGKITWAGIDSSGSKVSPGIYYVKIIVSRSTGTEGTDTMFKLVVQ